MFIPREPLTKENIFKRITSYDIFKYYCSGFSKVGKLFNSELRKDSNPSCCISNIGGELLYTDFGEGSYRAIDYVMAKYQLSFVEALHKINADFKLGLSATIPFNAVGGYIPPTTYGKVHFKEKTPTIIKIKSRDFTSKDLQYWNEYYWTEWMLKESKTKSLSHYWINDNIFYVDREELCFSYDYYYHSNRFQRKLYFPEKTTFKWISNMDNTIVQLVDVAPKSGDILFITSSKKDAGIFWRIQLESMFPDLVIHGVAPNNEGAFVPEEWFYKMKERWKRIIIWYNNDWNKPTNTGVKNAAKYAEKYGIEYYFNPDNEPKDPSDFAKKYDLKAFKELLESKIYSVDKEIIIDNNEKEIPF